MLKLLRQKLEPYFADSINYIHLWDNSFAKKRIVTLKPKNIHYPRVVSRDVIKLGH